MEKQEMETDTESGNGYGKWKMENLSREMLFSSRGLVLRPMTKNKRHA